MHSRNLLLLNVVLAIAAVLLAARLASDWKRADLRYSRPLPRETAMVAVPGAGTRPVPAVAQIVAKNLFMPDRNSDLAQAKPSGPPPVLPVIFGTMKLGGGFEALAAEGEPSKRGVIHRVKKGEQIGPYDVVDIQDDKVIVELDGQKTTLNVYESAKSVERSAERTVEPASPVVDAAAAPEAPASASNSASAANSGAGALPPTEPGVRSRVEGDRIRYERDTAFGTAVWYQPLPK